MVATGTTVGLAEWIIDDTCFVKTNNSIEIKSASFYAVFSFEAFCCWIQINTNERDTAKSKAIRKPVMKLMEQRNFSNRGYLFYTVSIK